MSEDSQKQLRLAEYWDARYAGNDPEQQGSHEWFRTYEDLRPFLLAHLPKPELLVNIAHFGCGTSTLPADLYQVGYKNQFGVDFSSIAIKAMREKYANLDGIVWRVMDVRSMDFEDKTFDIAIDKGTLDVMLYGSLWDPEDQVKKDARAYIDEIYRTLKPSGKWLYITYRQPHFIRQFVQDGRLWKVDVETLGGQNGSFEYFGFIITKGLEDDE